MRRSEQKRLFGLRPHRRGHLLFVCIFMRMLSFPAAAYGDIPPAGSSISSISTATYEADNSTFTAASNEITLDVLPVYGPGLEPDGTTDSPSMLRGAFGGETVYFPFNLANKGNTVDAFDLVVASLSPSDFVPSYSAVYLDADGDSVVDGGERIVTQVGPMAAGDSVSLILAAGLPVGLYGGETAHLDLQARSVSDPSALDAGNVVRITARNDAMIALSLESDEDEVMPGEEITYTINFSNTGDRQATDVVISDYVDYSGIGLGTVFLPGSVGHSPPGAIEYYDAGAGMWVDVAPAPENVKGVRIILEALPPGMGGYLSFRVRVRDDRDMGEILNSAAADYRGGDLEPYQLASNEITVLVGMVSSLSIGPEGNPAAESGTPEDCVSVSLNGNDTTYTFWHEVLNAGNYTDTVLAVLPDSTVIPQDWNAWFVDSTGAPINGVPGFAAVLGPIARDRSMVVGLRFGASPDRFRSFGGRDLVFGVEVRSLVDENSRDGVADVLSKTDLPLLSVRQSIREPAAMVGDVLSYIVTVENLTEETRIDSIRVVENLSAGLGFAGGGGAPDIEGNTLIWRIGHLDPGEKHEIVFRARVKAGQEWGRLSSLAWVYGVSELGERASDGPAVASVGIVEGIFTRRGIIFGGVFYDSDGDANTTGGEPGVPGIRVFIEDGTYAVTDSAGLYSIPGIVEGTHVVRVDASTLPDSLIPANAGYFGLGVSGELMIDLPASGNRRADFLLKKSAAIPEGETSAALGGDVPAVARKDTSVVFGEENLPGPASDGVEGEPGGEAPGDGYNAFTITDTHFMPGEATLEEIPLRQLAALGLWLREHPGWELSVVGHTDSIPICTEEFPSNFELSLHRAREVFRILRMNGIGEDRLEYSGSGSREPVATNGTAEGRARNRRVEIRAIPPVGYVRGDPHLSEVLNAPDTTVFSLADGSGLCSEVVRPEEGHVFYRRDEIDVEVASPLTGEVELYVNNVPVGIEKIGKKEVDVGAGTLTQVFYGVKIKVGRNEILVVCRDFGGKKNICRRNVYLAGRPSGIVPETETVSVPADGRERPELVFLVNDDEGLPVRDGIFADVDGSGFLLDGLDADPSKQGVQVPTGSGRISMLLPASREKMRERIHVSIEGITGSCIVEYTSHMHSWFVMGYGEGELGYSDLDGTGSTNNSMERHRSGGYAEGKISLYGQGEVRGGHLVTCALDSRPVREDRLFREIEPEKYYPVYGDASSLKYNAVSRSGTYLRLDHREYSAMVGDFRTGFGASEFSSYHRAFNGITGSARFGSAGFKGFVTRTDQITYQEEIPADGTSGFYFLEHYPLIRASEKVRTEIRDRYRPEKVIRVEYMQLNRDYDINYMDGSILFKEPVPASDDNLNPVTIVVSYECKNGSGQNFIYGMRASVEVRDSLRIGATAILEEEGVENSSIVGLDFSALVHREVAVEGGIAQSEKFLLGCGSAYRLKLRGRHGTPVSWAAYYREIDDNFFNPSFTGGKTELGSRKLGADVDWRITRAFSVNARGFRHRLRERNELKEHIALTGECRTKALSGEIGFAGSSESDTRDGDHSSTLLLAALGAERGRTGGRLEWDQILSGEETQEFPNRLKAELSRGLWANVRASLRHEYRTGKRTGTRHFTQIGLESKLGENLNMFSRYSLEGAMSGERGQATIGLKNRFKVSEDLTATFAAEKLATVSGETANDFLSFAAGGLYTPGLKDYRVKGDYEISLQPDRRKHLAAVAGIKRMSDRWAAMIRGDLWFSDEKVGNDRVKGGSMIGLSLRPEAAGPLTLLGLLRMDYERNSPAHPAAVDKEFITSIEANYAVGGRWELEGKFACRFVRNMFKGYSADATTFLYQGQLIRIIRGRWDVGLTGRIVHQQETRTVRYGGGLEAGRLMAENLWLGIGYDFGGHSDSDADINDFTRSGFHVRLRWKFDERLMKYFHGEG